MFFFTRRNVQQILKLPQKCKTRLFSIVTQPVLVFVVVDFVDDDDVVVVVDPKVWSKSGQQ